MHRLIEILQGAGLVDVRDDRLRLTARGREIATQDHQQNNRLLAKALLHSGYLSEQIRLLLERSSRSSDGQELRCPRGEASRAAPQVIGLLRCWSEVTFCKQLVIPVGIACELLDFWAAREVGGASGAAKDKIGLRAELYSFQFERERAADPSNIVWVAQEDDTLGYDIMDLTRRPRRLIEVKGSGGETLRFYASENELHNAEIHRDSYEVQFWGGINLKRPKPDEYHLLREQGFPRLISDMYGAIESGRLTSKPVSFLVSEASAF